MSDAPHVFEVTAAQFEADVLVRSQATPVLLDFWAEWCGPCRTLGPVLEKLADEYGGAFVLGKVDSDREAELAQAFQVQGLPFCVLLADGRPVDAFTGALPEAEVRKFLERAGITPLAGEAEEGEQEAVDPDSSAARLVAGKAALLRGDIELAQERLQGIEEEAPERGVASRLSEGLALMGHEVPGDAPPAAGPLAKAQQAFLAQDMDGAAEALLESLAADNSYLDALARRALLMCFEFMGEGEEGADRVAAIRRRMAVLLY